MSDDELCAAKQTPHSLDSCKLTEGHDGRHSDPSQGVSWPRVSPRPGPAPAIPRSVRTRVELHRAQTAYDLTILRDRLDTVTVSTSESRRLRARREQLTAELDAWSYRVKIAGSPR